MGLANVYSFARISNWHLPFRFKATFQATENSITTDNKSVISFAVKSITKPHFPLGTNSINQYYGTTRFVMPTLDFDKATLDITFVEEDSGRLQNFLMSLLGNATGGPTAVENIRIDEYDMGMTMLLSSRVYTCQLKSIDLPDYSRSGSASIVTVTGHFVVHSIKNVSLALSDMQNPADIDKTAEKDMNDTAEPPENDASPINDVTPPVPPEPPKPPPKRIAGDDPAMQAANKQQDQAIKDTDKVLSTLMDNMYANASADNQEELVNAGYEAYKKDHSKNAMLGDAIDEAGMQEEWSNISEADKMRYMLLAQGIDVTDGISDDESSRDENGKTEMQRLTETLAMMSDAKQEELEDDEKYKKFLATDVAIIAKVSENENAARENTKKVNDEVNEQINKEEAEKAKAALEARQQQEDGTSTDPNERYKFPDYKGMVPPAEMLPALPKDEEYGKMRAYFKPNDLMSSRSSINDKRDVKNEQFYLTKYSWMNMAFKDDLTVGEQKTILKTRYGLQDDDFTSTEKLSTAMDKANRRLVEAGSTERIWNTVGLCGGGTSWLYGMVNLNDEDKFYQGENDKTDKAWSDAAAGLLTTERKNLKSEKSNNYAGIGPDNVESLFGMKVAHDSTGSESNYEYSMLNINKKDDEQKTKELLQKVKSGEAKFVAERYLGQEGYMENGGIATEIYIELQEDGKNKRYMVASGLERSDALIADPDGESRWYVNKTEDKNKLAGSANHAFHQNFDTDSTTGLINTNMTVDAYYYDYNSGKMIKDSKTKADGVNTHGTQYANQGVGCLLIDAPTVKNKITNNTTDGTGDKHQNKKNELNGGGWSKAAQVNAASSDTTIGRAAGSYTAGQNYSQKLASLAFDVFGTNYTANGAGSFRVENRYNAGSTHHINSLPSKKNT